MLRLENLCKAYGGHPVLKNLRLTLQPGELYGLLGPNGAGKTTAINIVCGLLAADAGWVTLAQRPITPATKAWIGVMPQDNLLYRSLTGWEHLEFFARLYGVPRAERRQRLWACLQAVNLIEQAHRPVEALSGGMQRRLSLALALVHHPKLLILDEPTTGLDLEARHQVWALIRQLAQGGMTILLTSHLLDEVERLCQRIGILKQGQLLAEGTLESLRQRIPAAEVVTVQTSDGAAAIARGRHHGFTPRRYGTELVFWVPQALPLAELLACFEGIAIDSIARQPVRLEHIYLEVTHPDAASV